MEINLSELKDLIGAQNITGEEPESPFGIPSGPHIVVLDRGFVYVGNVSIRGDYVHIENARNIRKWGTNNGLGELVNGPLPETVLDQTGKVIAPLRAVIHYIACKNAW